MDFVTMKAKTQVKVVGIVNQQSLYVNKENKEYHSVDLLVNGHKNCLNVKLPEGFPRQGLVEGSLAELSVVISEYKGNTFITATLPIASTQPARS